MARSNIDLIDQLITSWICVGMAEVSGSTARDLDQNGKRWIDRLMTDAGYKTLLVLTCREPDEDACKSLLIID